MLKSLRKGFCQSTQHRFMSTFAINKILIANRGEIARRVIKTAKKMNIKTVAVYSDADRHSMFVAEADQAYRIGSAPSHDSYLNIEKIVDVIRKTKANGVHPGYGFLSENPKFQKAVDEAGAKFIGPPQKAIIAMGDKIQSKKLAREAKVNTVPGFLGTIEKNEDILRISHEIGYPVMIKASAGGGGKGMRIAWNDKEAIEGYKLSKEEARSAFGDDRIFIEKYIEEPRHIEFQIIGDQFGNYVYMPERECSVQRRNQKVIEEAPSPLLTPQIRAKMGEQACQMARSCDYYSTGTVEFLVDKSLDFYFLEMNTRLQVEHPISEEITGIDLVEEMIKIAEGQKLRMSQNDIKINGHAVEYRIYAEDPSRNFLPSIGFLERYAEPKPHPKVRIDTGVTEGSQISMYYDPMISKLVTHGANRKEALDLMNDVVDDYVVTGVKHNLGFCKAIVNNPAFAKGEYSTKFIKQYFPQGYHGPTLSLDEEAKIAFMAAVSYYNNYLSFKTDIPEQMQAKCLYIIFQKTKETFRVDYTFEGQFGIFKKAKESNQWEKVPLSEQRLEFEVEGHLCKVKEGEKVMKMQYVFQANGQPSSINMNYKSANIPVQVYRPQEYELLQHMPPKHEIDSTKVVQSPMPGTVVSVSVKEGDKVVAGQTVMVLEAMKMQNMIKVEEDKVVKKVLVKENQSVAVDQVLIEFE